MSNTTTVVIRGKASYAKILGDPVLNFSKDGKEWKMDVKINKDTVKELTGYGIKDKIKTKEGYLDGEPHLTFKQAEFQKSGKPNEPIKVTDILGNPWNDKELIGNDSDVDIKFVIIDYGAGKRKGMYIRSVRVLKLVPFNKADFGKVDETDEFYLLAKEAEAKALAEHTAMVDAADESPPFDMDDDIDDVGDEEV